MSRSPSSSNIKPHLLRLSGDDGRLRGMIAERVVEDAFADDRHDPSGPASHIIVIPTRKPTRLSWKTDGHGRKTTFAPGEIIVNPKGNFVAPRWSEPTEFLLLGIDSRFLSTCLGESELPDISLAPKFRFRDGLLHHLAQALIANYEPGGPADPLYADALGRALTLHLAKISGQPPRQEPRNGLPPNKLRLLDDYIHARLSEEIRLGELAAVTGISPSHFVVLLRRATGMSPHRYVTAKRLDSAKHLLLRTHLSVAEIALRCGFCDQSHLTRVMRRHTGSTPGKFRS